MKYKICIPIQANKMEGLEVELEEAQTHADFVEIWLDQIDGLKKSQVESIVAMVEKPLIVVCKGKTEHGAWLGTEEARVDMLIEAKESGADYIDIGLDTDPRLIKKLKNAKGTGKLIISFHDFKKTPDLKILERIIQKQKDLGADVIKLATFASRPTDNYTILQLVSKLADEGQEVIGLCMGEHGKLSRIESTKMGGMLMFAPINKNKATASGQLTVEELRTSWEE